MYRTSKAGKQKQDAHAQGKSSWLLHIEQNVMHKVNAREEGTNLPILKTKLEDSGLSQCFSAYEFVLQPAQPVAVCECAQADLLLASSNVDDCSWAAQE